MLPADIPPMTRNTCTMIRSIFRSSQGVLTQNLTIDQMKEALKDAKGTLWLDLVPPPESSNEQIGAILRDLFHFHPLAVDDALNESHVPRIDDWQEYVYIVLHALDLEVNRSLESQEVDVFL